MGVLTNMAKILKLQFLIAKQTAKIKHLKDKRKKAFDDKISRETKARADNVKKLTALGGTLEGEDCEKGKPKKPKKPKK